MYRPERRTEVRRMTVRSREGLRECRNQRRQFVEDSGECGVQSVKWGGA